MALGQERDGHRLATQCSGRFWFLIEHVYIEWKWGKEHERASVFDDVDRWQVIADRIPANPEDYADDDLIRILIGLEP